MRTVDDITNFIFVEDPPAQADVIFIPGGSWPELAERAAEIWRAGFAPYVLPSGKYSVHRGFFAGASSKKDLYPGPFDTEWAFLRHVLAQNGVAERAILREDEASLRGTLDNAFLSRGVTDALGLTIRRGIVCCKSFHARRCLMTYQWAYPEAELLICPADVAGKSRHNWYANDEGRERVMDELRKCGAYFREAMGAYTQNGA